MLPDSFNLSTKRLKDETVILMSTYPGSNLEAFLGIKKKLCQIKTNKNDQLLTLMNLL